MKGNRYPSVKQDLGHWPPFKFSGKLDKVTVELRPEGTGGRAIK